MMFTFVFSHQLIIYNSFENGRLKHILYAYVTFEAIYLSCFYLLLNFLNKNGKVIPSMIIRSAFFNMPTTTFILFFPTVLIQIINNKYFLIFFFLYLLLTLFISFLYTYEYNDNNLIERSKKHWLKKEEKNNETLFINDYSLPKLLQWNNMFFLIGFLPSTALILFYFIVRFNQKYDIYYSTGIMLFTTTFIYPTFCYWGIIIKTYLNKKKKHK